MQNQQALRVRSTFGTAKGNAFFTKQPHGQKNSLRSTVAIFYFLQRISQYSRKVNRKNLLTAFQAKTTENNSGGAGECGGDAQHKARDGKRFSHGATLPFDGDGAPAIYV